MARDIFKNRHIGVHGEDVNAMLQVIGENSVERLVEKTIPASIRLKKALDLESPLTEQQFLEHIEGLGKLNVLSRNYIGQGYSETIVPPVIQRNVLENPGWYTAYTPYQAEISQGRLEALLNFQTMLMDLTGMEMANASLLDEATAAGEAMIMFYNARSRAQKKENVAKFFVDDAVYAQTKSVLKTRATPLGIELVFGDYANAKLDATFFGAMVQYPNAKGAVKDYQDFASYLNENEIKLAVAADIMSLVLLKSPGSWGADAVFGNTQRFGVPMGYGGPHAAYYATKEEYKRYMPGRIIGVSEDTKGRPALRMALQTREQHIKRDKATSNICTAQALLAVMASMYAVYHGPQGLKTIAKFIHKKALSFALELEALGYKVVTKNFFDTVHVQLPEGVDTNGLKAIAEASKINLFYLNDNEVLVSFGEVGSISDLFDLVQVFANAVGKEVEAITLNHDYEIADELRRNDEILTQKVFNSYHTETKMMRYLKHLENKDLSLVHSMIPLGSCTMKLNAAAQLMPLTMPEFANMHPFQPFEQAKGYTSLLNELAKDLAEITGFAGTSLQPNSGAQGEYAGLMVIRAYHEANGDHHRNICLIPSSAHGTNPASAVMAGMKVVVVACDERGNIDINDLKAKAEEHKDNLSAFMITYPSTHGVYEEAVIEYNQIIHDNGGQVYMDGANMNAQVGLTNPGNIGADVCHLNLHKTFAIPHGGGGPGMGPICVAKHLVPFLPGHAIISEINQEQSIDAISAAPYGSALILIISYAYIKMLGAEGLKASTETAILNANYIKARLEGHYNILYTGTNNTVAHEMILDCRDFKKTAGVEVADIAKRLMDYGFHAPTVAFPVAGTLMVEPTESEAKDELDRFCDAMISIREEIKAVEANETLQGNNVVVNAPHTAEELVEEWPYAYSRSEAVYPLPYVKNAKYWPPVKKIDNALGDRNLVCSCTPIEAYL